MFQRLSQSKEITKKVYSNINIKTDTIFMNSENSKTSKAHVLIVNLTDKIDLRRGEKALLYQILVYIIHGKT